VRNSMIVLTLNSGSTSVELAAYETDGAHAPTRLDSEHHSGQEIEPRAVLPAFLAKVRASPDVVAHRVVHGGTRFTGPTRIDETRDPR